MLPKGFKEFLRGFNLTHVILNGLNFVSQSLKTDLICDLNCDNECG